MFILVLHIVQIRPHKVDLFIRKDKALFLTKKLKRGTITNCGCIPKNKAKKGQKFGDLWQFLQQKKEHRS